MLETWVRSPVWDSYMLQSNSAHVPHLWILGSRAGSHDCWCLPTQSLSSAPRGAAAGRSPALQFERSPAQHYREKPCSNEDEAQPKTKLKRKKTEPWANQGDVLPWPLSNISCHHHEVTCWNWLWDSWQNQMSQRNQPPAQGRCLTNTHEGPWPWKSKDF